jgi:hypothetical protein
MSNFDRFKRGTGANVFASTTVVPDANGRVTLYVNGATGDDANNGLFGHLVVGVWCGQRAGPKKSITSALNAVSNAKSVELHLDGNLDMPQDGFWRNGAAFDLVMGQNGANLGVVPPPTIQAQQPNPSTP